MEVLYLHSILVFGIIMWPVPFPKHVFFYLLFRQLYSMTMLLCKQENKQKKN